MKKIQPSRGHLPGRSKGAHKAVSYKQAEPEAVSGRNVKMCLAELRRSMELNIKPDTVNDKWN